MPCVWKNRPQSSRWYPGAGLYRNVHLIVTDKIHVPVWGTQITTPHVNKDFAAVRLQTKIDNAGEKTAIRVETEIISPEGKGCYPQREYKPHQSRTTF